MTNVRDELIRLAEAWVDAERDELLDTPIKAAKAAFLSYVDTLQPDGRVMVPRDVLADADKMIAIYDNVHGELEENGDDWPKIDLVKHGFNEAARRMSYANWRGYMTGAIYHALKAVALIHRQQAQAALQSDTDASPRKDPTT